MPNTREGWHPEDIKAAIRKKGFNLRQLALENGLFESAVRSAVIRPCLPGETVIAAFIGVPAQELWPDRYEVDGTPRHRHSKHAHRIATAAASQRQKSNAA